MRFSLKKRIMLQQSAIAILLIVSLLAGFALFSETRLIEQAEDTAEQNLSVVYSRIEMMADQIQNSSVLMLTSDQIQGWLKEIIANGEADPAATLSLTSYLYTMTRLQFITNIVVHPNAGHHTRRTLFQYEDPGEAALIEDFTNQDSRIMWDFRRGVSFNMRGADARRNMLCFYQKVFNSWTMEQIGVLEIMIDEAQIAEFYRGIRMGDTGYFCIFDGDKGVVSTENQTQIDAIRNSISGLERDARDRARLRAGGEDLLLLSMKYDRFGWTIAGIVKVSELTKVVRKMIAFALILGTVAVGVAVLFASISASSLSRPIVRLKDAMIRVGSGARDIQLSRDRTDEIGDLNREFLRMIREVDELNERVRREQNDKMETELALVLSQLSPHFLYNSLECICGLSAMGMNEDAINALNALSRFYRAVFYAKDKMTTVRNELDMARNYFSIMSYRFPDKLHYALDCDEDIQDCQIVNMTLQPILENAILHGLRNSRRQWEVEVNAYGSGGDIVITVWDNGIGMSQETIDEIFRGKQPDSRTHFGLRATNERVKKICGDGYGLQVYSTPGSGTMIVVNFPRVLEKREEDVQGTDR